MSHVTLGRACHMISRTKQSKGKKGRGKQSKRKQSRSEANQIVTPGMSHVIPGRACHMLPWGARVTCNPFSLETSTSEVRTCTGFATLCCVGPASLFDVPSAGRSPALTFRFHLHVQLCPPRLQRTSSTTREYADTLTLSLSSSATSSAAAHERDRCCNPRGRGEGLASPLKHQDPRGECYAPLRRTSGPNAQVDAPSHRPFVTLATLRGVHPCIR